MANNDPNLADAADYDLIPVDHVPQFADAPIPKAGQQLPPQVTSGDVSGQAGELTKSILGNVTGLSDAYRALSGQMTPEEQQQMFVMALPGLIPGARAETTAMKAAEEAAPAIARGIRAYHGSPYDFDQFDLSKIGTGEGAQAYGHGLYFAENPETANAYRPTAPDLPVNHPINKAARTLDAIQDQIAPMTDKYWSNSMADFWANRNRPGKTYEVNINADPEHFLDWDKPLSEQSPKVRAAYQKLMGTTVDPADAAAKVRSLEEQMQALASDRDPVTNQMRGERQWMQLAKERDAAWEQWNATQSGQKVWEALNRELPRRQYNAPPIQEGETYDQWAARRTPVGERNPASTAEALRDAGIPGIKYLDQGSRAGARPMTSYMIREGDNGFNVVSPEPDGSLKLHGSAPTREAAEQMAYKLQNPPQTSNYVVFNDKLIDIVKKYGLAGVVGAGASHFQTVPVDHQPDFGDQPQERAAGGRVEAANIDAEPTEAQKKAGNYAKDHVHVHGLDITIENAKGHYRRGIGGDGKPWQVKMPAHYGYIKGTVGKDKDHVDVYLGPHLQSPTVWIVDQVNADSRKFDEHKAFVGFASKQHVVETYRKAFSDGRAHERLGHLTRMNIETFKHWLETGNMKKTADAHFPDAPRDNDKNKTTKKEAAYRGGTKNKRCQICSMFVAPDGCTAVRGKISPWAVCKFFERKK